MAPWDGFATACLFVTFGVAVPSKLRSRRAFALFRTGLGQFGIRYSGAQYFMAATVLALELGALALLADIEARPIFRFGIPVLLLTGFTVAMLLASRHHARVVCHCFGSTTTTDVRAHALINLLLILVAVSTLLLPDGPNATGGDLMLGLGLGLIAGVAVVAFDVIKEAVTIPKAPDVRQLEPRTVR